MTKAMAGPVFLTFGAIVCWVGYAMWRSPHLNWGSFVDSGLGAVFWVWDEMVRFSQDPLAVVGLVVMAVGGGVLLGGLALIFKR